MRAKRMKLALAVTIAVVCAAGLYYLRHRPAPSAETQRVVRPVRGDIQRLISSTGTVLPKNRLEIKPPVAGRVEEVLVREGQKVSAGETIAWMSSTERAALIDAARGQGKEALEYWQQVYKAIPLVSPIDAEVIVATTQPGQTVATSDAVVVLSDQLIVRAQVDETDIGKVSVGQPAFVKLDAYPDTRIASKVGHIYYESKTVNNVTIYEVDLLPESIPEFLRSGMNASVDFIVEKKEGVLLVPAEAVIKDNGNTFVLVSQPEGKEPLRQPVTLGLSDDKNVEITSGLEAGEDLLVKTKKYALPRSADSGTNPFMPSRRRSR